MMCLDGTLLLWLNVVPTNSKEVTEVASSCVQVMTVQWIEIPLNLPVIGILFEGSV
jgi:hypothetical protein